MFGDYVHYLPLNLVLMFPKDIALTKNEIEGNPNKIIQPNVMKQDPIVHTYELISIAN